MHGVVLWRNEDRSRAVIWCEDHSELAFFSAPPNGGGAPPVRLETGDLVQFDLYQEAGLRMVRDPRVIGPCEYPGLAKDLIAAAKGRARDDIGCLPEQGAPVDAEARQGASRVVEFAAHLQAQPQSPGGTMARERAGASRDAARPARPARPARRETEVVFRIFG